MLSSQKHPVEVGNGGAAEKDIISVQRQGRGKEMGDVCREEIVENNGNKTKG